MLEHFFSILLFFLPHVLLFNGVHNFYIPVSKFNLVLIQLFIDVNQIPFLTGTTVTTITAADTTSGGSTNPLPKECQISSTCWQSWRTSQRCRLPISFLSLGWLTWIIILFFINIYIFFIIRSASWFYLFISLFKDNHPFLYAY